MAKFVPQPELSLNDQMQIRREKLAALQAEGRDPFVITKFEVSAHAAEIQQDFERMEGQIVSLAGRLMGRRDMGKANFIDLQDKTGRIQIFANIGGLGEEAFAEFKSGTSATSSA